MRQAEAVLRHKPDIIIFEAPNNTKTTSSIFNKFRPHTKPTREFAAIQKRLKTYAENYPWIVSDIHIYDNIKKLWDEGHDVKLFNVDGPSELLRVGLKKFSSANTAKPERRGTNLMWWVRIYLREKIMARNIKQILERKTLKKDAVVLIFLQSFHWRNVQFLLANPAKQMIWKYYFGTFKKITPKTVGKLVKSGNRILYQYWKKFSDFKP